MADYCTEAAKSCTSIEEMFSSGSIIVGTGKKSKTLNFIDRSTYDSSAIFSPCYLSRACVFVCMCMCVFFILQVKSRTATGKEKYIADPDAEEREIPIRMMACKGCEFFVCLFFGGGAVWIFVVLVVSQVNVFVEKEHKQGRGVLWGDGDAVYLRPR